MSTGIVVCSVCYREVHQTGGGWTHCEYGLPICAGAKPVYPGNVKRIVGKWCGRDDFQFFPELLPHRPGGKKRR